MSHQRHIRKLCGRARGRSAAGQRGPQDPQTTRINQLGSGHRSCATRCGRRRSPRPATSHHARRPRPWPRVGGTARRRSACRPAITPSHTRRTICATNWADVDSINRNGSHQEALSVTDERKPKVGWRERRREARRKKAEREGDTPEKLAERTRTPAEGTTRDNAGQASIGATVNGLPQ